jgi:hypothetical protein
VFREDIAIVASTAAHRPAVRAWRPLLAALLLAVSAGLLQEALNTVDVPPHAVVWGGLAMAAYGYGLLCVLLTVRGAGQGLGSWRLGPWMILWCGTMYGLSTVTLSRPQSGTTAEIALSDVLRALLLVAVGTTMWVLGYVIGPRRWLQAGAARTVSSLQRRFSADVRSPLTPWILFAIGAVAQVIDTFITGRLGYVGDVSSSVTTASGYSQVFALLGFCAPVGVAAAALQVFRQRMLAARTTMIILFLAEIGFAAASGNKQNFVTAVLAIAIPYSAAYGRLPMTMLVIFAIIFLAVVVPFTQAYRGAVRGATATLTAGQAVGGAPGILRQILNGENNLVTTVPDSISSLLKRGQDIDSPAIIIQRTPSQIGFSNPADLVTGPLTGLVPRALWPGKPILATGYQFGQQYFEVPSSLYSSPAITPIGDLYRHGGWVPVIAGMFLFGCGIRLADDALDIRTNPHAIFLLLFLFPSLVMSEQDWITLLAVIPAYVLLWLLTVAITFRGQRRRPT